MLVRLVLRVVKRLFARHALQLLDVDSVKMLMFLVFVDYAESSHPGMPSREAAPVRRHGAAGGLRENVDVSSFRGYAESSHPGMPSREAAPVRRQVPVENVDSKVTRCPPIFLPFRTSLALPGSASSRPLPSTLWILTTQRTSSLNPGPLSFLTQESPATTMFLPRFRSCPALRHLPLTTW